MLVMVQGKKRGREGLHSHLARLVGWFTLGRHSHNTAGMNEVEEEGRRSLTRKKKKATAVTTPTSTTATSMTMTGQQLGKEEDVMMIQMVITAIMAA